MNSRALLVNLALLMVLIAGGCKREEPSATQPSTAKEQHAKPVTVRVGYLPIAAGLPLFVAVEKGYFADAGFDVQLTRFSSSNELGTAATVGQIDALMPFALNAAFDIGTVSGKKHRLFGCNIYSDQKPHIVDYLVARKNSGIKTIGDLRNRRVAGFPGSVTKIFVEHILRKQGLDSKDYTYVEMGPGDWLPALQGGSVDAASVMEPQASMIIAKDVGDVVVEGFFAKLMADVPLSGHWLSADFVNANDLATQARFVSAYGKAVDFIRERPEEAKQYYLKYIGVDADAIANMQINVWRKPEEIKRASIKAFADLLFENGALQADADVADYIWRPE